MTNLETLKLKMLALAVELDPYEDPDTFKKEINAGPIDLDDIKEQTAGVLAEYNDSEYDGDIIALCNDIIRLCDELSADFDDENTGKHFGWYVMDWKMGDIFFDYLGDDLTLEQATEKTRDLWARLSDHDKKLRKQFVLLYGNDENGEPDFDDSEYYTDFCQL